MLERSSVVATSNFIEARRVGVLSHHGFCVHQKAVFVPVCLFFSGNTQNTHGSQAPKVSKDTVLDPSIHWGAESCAS